MKEQACGAWKFTLQLRIFNVFDCCGLSIFKNVQLSKIFESSEFLWYLKLQHFECSKLWTFESFFFFVNFCNFTTLKLALQREWIGVIAIGAEWTPKSVHVRFIGMKEGWSEAERGQSTRSKKACSHSFHDFWRHILHSQDARTLQGALGITFAHIFNRSYGLPTVNWRIGDISKIDTSVRLENVFEDSEPTELCSEGMALQKYS